MNLLMFDLPLIKVEIISRNSNFRLGKVRRCSSLVITYIALCCEEFT